MNRSPRRFLGKKARAMRPLPLLPICRNSALLNALAARARAESLTAFNAEARASSARATISPDTSGRWNRHRDKNDRIEVPILRYRNPSIDRRRHGQQANRGRARHQRKVSQEPPVANVRKAPGQQQGGSRPSVDGASCQALSEVFRPHLAPKPELRWYARICRPVRLSFPALLKGCSSAGRAAASKAACRAFESCRPCHFVYRPCGSRRSEAPIIAHTPFGP